MPGRVESTAGLALLDALVGDERLRGYHRCAGPLGRRDEAAAAYRKALELVGNDPERDFLRLRLAELADWRSALSRR